MCLIFTCGEHTFRKEVEGYESVTCQCHNCGNWSGHVIKTHPWFTFCFIVSIFIASRPRQSPEYPLSATAQHLAREAPVTRWR